MIRPKNMSLNGVYILFSRGKLGESLILYHLKDQS